MTDISTFTYADQDYFTGRMIGHVKGTTDGPRVVFIGAIHGNEPSGVIALKQLFAEIEGKEVRGEVIGVVGNMAALDKGRRFMQQDLNRMWTAESIHRLSDERIVESELGPEERELIELLRIFNGFRMDGRPTYFIDLHTTSSESMPFLSISRTLANIDFASALHVPTVVGIERFIKGPLLDHMSTEGHVSLAFEAGQHTSDRSVRYQLLFIREVLHQLELYSSQDTINSVGNVRLQGSYELKYRHDITGVDDFKMRAGYTNFDRVMKGEVLATQEGREIEAPCEGRIFMPLYQAEGNDGFFIITEG